MKKLLNNSELQTVSLDEIRSAIRRGFFHGHTSGLAKGKLQGNLMVLPKDFAEDFMRFCLANSKPCPLIAIGDVGSPLLPSLGIDLDIRTDIPAYNVYRDGQYSESLSDITDLWSDDWVAFVLGCSFTFEAALDAAKVPLSHLNSNKNVSMYRTTVKTVSEGMFEADLVVSMRPIPKHQKQLVIQICEQFPFAHGAPCHWGCPQDIGIENLECPDWGDVIEVKEDEVPAFWACGVTTQLALQTAAPPIAISHKPGSMLITDVDNADAKLIEI
ncbi:MAG: hypothetical protein COA78_14935 [Blastopirellula sp.]|nr:MAG: hypothetical protein COA78_14935 [Blastopirellula sp.]